MTTRNKTSHIPPFGLRMQPELRAALEAAANKSGRSLNAEIVSRLEQSVAATDGMQGTVVDFDLSRVDPAVKKIYEAIALLETSTNRLNDLARQEKELPTIRRINRSQNKKASD